MGLAANQNHPVHVGFGVEKKLLRNKGFAMAVPPTGYRHNFGAAATRQQCLCPSFRSGTSPPALVLEVKSVKLVMYLSTSRWR